MVHYKNRCSLCFVQRRNTIMKDVCHWQRLIQTSVRSESLHCTITSTPCRGFCVSSNWAVGINFSPSWTTENRLRKAGSESSIFNGITELLFFLWSVNSPFFLYQAELGHHVFQSAPEIPPLQKINKTQYIYIYMNPVLFIWIYLFVYLFTKKASKGILPK